MSLGLLIEKMSVGNFLLHVVNEAFVRKAQG